MITEFKIYLKQGNKKVGYDYPQLLHGLVCDLAGDNRYGSIVSNYTYSNLHGEKRFADGIDFDDKKTYFTIRVNEENMSQVFKNIADGFKKKHGKDLFYGMRLDGIEINTCSEFTRNHFRTMLESPIKINVKTNGKEFNKKFFLDADDIAETEEYLKKNILKKARAHRFDADKDLSIKIRKQGRPRTVYYRGLLCNGRVFDLDIRCDEKTKEFIMLHGVGCGNGIGFGMIY